MYEDLKQKSTRPMFIFHRNASSCGYGYLSVPVMWSLWRCEAKNNSPRENDPLISLHYCGLGGDSLIVDDAINKPSQNSDDGVCFDSQSYVVSGDIDPKGVRLISHQRLLENLLCEGTKLSPLCFLQLFPFSSEVKSEFRWTQLFHCIWAIIDIHALYD